MNYLKSVRQARACDVFTNIGLGLQETFFRGKHNSSIVWLAAAP